MGKHVEGKWHKFQLRLAQSVDYQRILEHVNENFYREELVSQMVGYSKESSLNFDQKIVSYLSQNLSFIAVDTETQKIAGVCIMYESCKDEYSSSPGLFLEKNKIFQFLAELEDKCNIFSMFDISHCAKLLLTSLSQEYRGQGLGTELCRRSLALLRKKGFAMVKGSFCSLQSIKRAQKLGFQELARSYIKDFRDENGVCLFPETGFEFVALMALRL